jgi:hypothetical protein
MFATHPFSKRSNALASLRGSGSTPTASIVCIGDLTRCNDFQVVNHEIEHDTDVGAAIWKRRKAMRFNEARMGQTRLKALSTD